MPVPSKNVEKFLEAYRKYESMVRQAGTDALAAEGLVSDAVANRLRICRQIRNYLSHNSDPGFLAPTPEMIDFLNEQSKIWLVKCDLVKSHAKKGGVASDDESCAEVYARCVKLRLDLIPVRRGSGWKIVRALDIGAAAMAGKQSVISDVKVSAGPVPVVVRPDELYGAYQNRPADSGPWVCQDESKIYGLVV